ncbi:hypothetical protein J27TS7_16230 [Paenibacillus dendritiformis]|uniref:hypothetical protein n=1 Tax=Paenibacillus dendritiformis TaxID=130049 RepID=UPI001B10C27D|nr:hypothetical protein [Paenibacillus dendritiformis]GIO72109.1 hypothetical protein J27TS7_16230 [Paenibacillus dendritiformis]
MSEKHADKLLHVQNGAIRHLLYSKVDEQDLINRYRVVVKREVKRELKVALERLDKQKLVEIVAISPEITESDIETCFEDNRYSRRPNFRLFMLRPHNPQLSSSSFIADQKNNTGVSKMNELLKPITYPNDTIFGLLAIDQTVVNHETVEIALQYQERYNYINPETEQSDFIYELKFGFLWINFDQSFVSISIPTESLVGTISKTLERAFDCFVSPVNITKKIVNSVFSKESMKRTTLSNPDPESGKPSKVTLADSDLGNKVGQLTEFDGYDSPSSVYQEAIDEDGDFFSTLGVNNDKGKIYLTRQLKASEMRRWGIWRIGQIMNYINSIQENGEIDDKFESFGLDEDPDLVAFTTTNDEKKVILEVIKAVVTCKVKKIESFKLHDLNVDKIVGSLKKHTIAHFYPYCDSCDHYADITCNHCGNTDLLTVSVKRGQAPKVICSFCYTELQQDNVRCLMDHKVRIDSWYDGVVINPKSTLVELTEKIINKYFPDEGFSHEEESFYLQNNVVQYSSRVASKVMFKVRELQQFKPVWDRRITPKRRDELAEVLSLLTEKCSKHSVDACQACQHEKSVRCIMKPFVTFTDHKLHPHHGQEYGDISFTIQMLGMDDAVFVGIAKSYEKKPIKPTDTKAYEMLQQFVYKCKDTTVNVLGIVVAGELEQGFVAVLQDLAGRYKKKVVMWTYEELMLVVDFAIKKYDLSIAEVIEELKADKVKRKRKPAS